MNSKLTKVIIMCAISLNMLIAAEIKQKTPEKPSVISPASQKLIRVFAAVNRKLDQLKSKVKAAKDRVTIERLKADYQEQRQKLFASAVKIAIKLEQRLKTSRNQEKLIESEIVETKNEIKKLEPKPDSIADEKYYQALWKLRLLDRKLQILKTENDWNTKIILLLKQGQKKSSRPRRKLVWSDEFNYTGLPDAKKWNYEEGFIRNNEDQYYTRGRKENARVENDMLIIEARKEKFKNAAFQKGSSDWRKKDEFAKYTSASILTNGKTEWTYGRIEIRAKIPTGKGSWPALWMLGKSFNWPACGEIDIMENIGRNPDNIFVTVHFKSLRSGKHKQVGNSTIISKPYNDFHIYAVDWNTKKIDFFIDGKKHFTYTLNDDAGKGAKNAFRNPFFLIMNLALGGSWAKTLDPDILPLKYYIDYVRIYQ